MISCAPHVRDLDPIFPSPALRKTQLKASGCCLGAFQGAVWCTQGAVAIARALVWRCSQGADRGAVVGAGQLAAWRAQHVVVVGGA